MSKEKKGSGGEIYSLYFNLIKDVIEDVEFEKIQKNEYIINIALKTLSYKNSEVKNTIDNYYNNFLHKFGHASLTCDTLLLMS